MMEKKKKHPSPSSGLNELEASHFAVFSLRLCVLYCSSAEENFLRRSARFLCNARESRVFNGGSLENEQE